MAKTRQQKKDILKNVSEKIDASKSLVFANFDGLTVKEVEELRAKCRENNVGYIVAKKTMLKIAMEKAGIDVDPKTFENGVATVFGFEDEVAPAKIVQEFSKSHPNLKAISGVLEGQAVTLEKVVELSKLPSREELYAKVVGSIAAPVRGLVNVLAGNLRGLVYVLNAVKEKKEA
jgi:large subunit ribosomal protein L10